MLTWHVALMQPNSAGEQDSKEEEPTRVRPLNARGQVEWKRTQVAERVPRPAPQVVPRKSPR